ncbi:hypothetical protein [Pumilibacter muris]|uniref:hypothetical protein n=1 Tax=Pumilibacter muris TaxID=2941510 RepID=UPI00203ED6EB|nr:hypothetical protein [Pumilibacter muris]
MRKKITKIAAVLLGIVCCFAATGCDKGLNSDDGVSSVKMLISGYVNLPTDSNDPYRKWVRDNYNLDVKLTAVGNLSGTAVAEFASNDKPDIVVFDNMNEYATIAEQKVLLEDWTPYLSQMPNASKIVNMKDADNPDGDSVAKQMMSDGEKLKGVWTLPDTPTWSLKIREDWAEEYRATTEGGANYPAGNKATDGGVWQPRTPEDLLNFARWIKATKPNCYAFTSAGNQSSLGTLGNWLPLMWGTVAELPYGAYITEADAVSFPVVDGSHEQYINYLKQICDEGLIDPSWYVQSWENKTKTKQGLIGIEWYPGSITMETQMHNEGKDTVNWWKTYALPCADGFDGGYMPMEGYVGKIICVSKRAALNKDKMNAIVKFIDDCLVYFDESTGEYVRPVGYDALRWGVGVEKGCEYKDIDGSDYKYVNTSDTDEHKFYRNTTQGAGAYDWGAWIATTKDGVIQGSTERVDAITKKVVEHNSITSKMKSKVQIGSSLNLDATKVKDLNTNQIRWEYGYVTGAKVDSYATFRNKWKTQWGGDELLEEAERQFKEFGILK